MFSATFSFLFPSQPPGEKRKHGQTGGKAGPVPVAPLILADSSLYVETLAGVLSMAACCNDLGSSTPQQTRSPPRDS